MPELTSILTFSRLKCKRAPTDYLNSSFKLSCRDCSFKIGLRTNNLDVQRTVSHFMNRRDSLLFMHGQEHVDHCLGAPSIISSFESKRELLLSFPMECFAV